MTSKKISKKSQEEIVQFWKKVLGILQTELNPMTYNTWVKKIRVENLTEAGLDLLVDLPYTKRQLQKYSSLIQNAVNKVGQRKLKINYLIEKNLEETQSTRGDLGPLFESKKLTKPALSVISKSGLSPKFTFDKFIMGTSNQLAYAVAQAVAENPGETYNPFFLYSGVGLGKTHLTQAIGNRILQKNPKLSVVYTTGEAFMNELIEAIRSGKGRGRYTTNDFRKKFRKADVLLIDDIQIIVGRDTTQEELFHTFNTLYMAGRQIVLTSDRPPKEFTKLEKRITSRFGSGIIADIQHPDLDLRIAILRAKRDRNNDVIPNELIDFIAEHVEENIRELEGAYLQVLTLARTSGEEPSVELVQSVLGKNLDVKRQKPVSPNQILKAVCKYYSVKSTDIKGKRRTKGIVIPRQVAMYLIRELTDSPLMSIGDVLGGRDHTTIMHGIRKVEDEMLETGRIRRDVVNVKQLL